MFCLIKKLLKHKVKIIQAKKRKIGTYEIDKISLSSFDDKRQALDDGVHTLAYFLYFNFYIVCSLFVCIM